MSTILRRKQFDNAYMSIATIVGRLSYARKKQVGCIIVSEDDQIISQGFNGTPSGMDNNCEWDWCSAAGKNVKSPMSCCNDEGFNFVQEQIYCAKCIHYKLKTKPHVIHAESNAITKCVKSCLSTSNATLYVTLSPCIECAKLIIQAGIKRVIYKEYYNNPKGIDLLKNSGIIVEQLQETL